MNFCIRVSALLVLLSLAACAPGTVGGGSSESLSQQVARHDQQIQGILSQVGQVEQVLPGQAEMWSQVQTMRQELNQVHGQLDNLNIQLGGSGSGEIATMRENIRRLQAAVRQVASQLGVSIGELEAEGAASTSSYGGGGGAYPAVAPTAPAAPSYGETPPPAPAVNADTATTLYEAGIKAFDQRRYKDAVVSFKDFTANYPKHQLASNAAFWEGESHYQLKDYGRAALAYQEVLDKHKGSSKYQSALLKQGMALYYAGKKDAGKQRLQELVSRYPSSPETNRAKQFLTSNK